jgi:dethiobiotin synthetase/adenosylmethionine--8-amino-7-oxononanoate aminotransferase
MALLHGHSYTAHPVGCSVAKKSVETMLEMDETGKWRASKADWASEGDTGKGVWSRWRQAFIREVSQLQKVEGVFALGTVLAMSLKDNKMTGMSIPY